MINLNRILGDPSEKIKVKITAEVEFYVGGKDHEDRVDSVKQLLDDHYDDIIANSYFREGIVSMTTEIV